MTSSNDFRSLRRVSRIRACAQLVLAAVSAFWAPGSALLHGYAHAHEAQHVQASGVLRTAEPLRRTGPAVPAPVSVTWGAAHDARSSTRDAHVEPSLATIDAHDDDDHWHPSLHQQFKGIRFGDFADTLAMPIETPTTAFVLSSNGVTLPGRASRALTRIRLHESRPRAPPRG